MRLDAAAQRALNVLRQRTDANDSFSLYGLLNRGRTAMAKRLLKARTQAPGDAAVLTSSDCRLLHELLGPTLSVKSSESAAHASSGKITACCECMHLCMSTGICR